MLANPAHPSAPAGKVNCVSASMVVPPNDSVITKPSAGVKSVPVSPEPVSPEPVSPEPVSPEPVSPVLSPALPKYSVIITLVTLTGTSCSTTYIIRLLNVLEPCVGIETL